MDSPHAVSCGDAKLYLYVVNLVDEPGSLRQVLTVFESYGINIVGIYTTTMDYIKKRATAEVNIVADFTGKNVSAEQVARSLNLLTVVKDIKFTGKQLPDTLVDEFHYPLRVLGYRAIIYREPAYRELIMGLRSQLGTAGEALLYHIGLNIGRGVWSVLKPVVAENMKHLPEYIKYWAMIHSVSKIIEVTINLDEKKAVVKLEENYECSLAKNYGKPFSNLHRGFYAGLLSELLESEKSVETKCIAAGDPYCEYIIGKLD